MKLRIRFEDTGRDMQLIINGINPEHVTNVEYMQAAVYSALTKLFPNDDVYAIHWNAYDATTGEFITTSEY